jgi:hypothetical protein
MDETREGLAGAVEAPVEEIVDDAVAEIESFVGVVRTSAMSRGFATLEFDVAKSADTVTEDAVTTAAD